MATVFLNRLVRNLHLAVEAQRCDTVTDAELLDRFQANADANLFEAIIRRHGVRVLSACRKVLRESADIEDAFQATFLVLLRQASRIRQQQSLGGWLYGVAHRIALQARARSARRSRAESHKQTCAEQEPDLSWREACAILHEELDRLPENYRLPLLLCYLEGKSRDEAAQQLGCTVGTLHGRLERGRERLRFRLTRRGVTLSTGLLTAVASSVSAGGPPQILIEAILAAATAGRCTATVATLVHGATTPMTFGKIKLVAIVLLAFGLLSAGLGWQILGAPSSFPAKPGADNAPRAASEPKPGKAPKDSDKNTVQLSGRVLGPDAKPVPGARLFTPRLKKNPPASIEDLDAVQVGTSGTDGRFQVTLKKPAPEPRRYLLAHADGFGVDWIERGPEEADADNIVLKLVKDQAITGRVLDTEGKPQAGLHVSIGAIYVPENDKLDDYLTGWKKNWRDTASTPKKRLYFPFEAIHGLTTTDTNGHFKVTGVGSERIVHLTIQGKGVAKAMSQVLTRAGLDPKPYNEAAFAQVPAQLRIKGQLPILSGPQASIVVEVGKVIEGVVKDLATGKPLAGIPVNAMFGFGDGAGAVTDGEGKYRIPGLPQEKKYRVFALPPAGSTYLRRTASADATPGSAPIRLDVELAKGVVVSGRVIDRETGKGVQAGIRFAPLTENKHFGKPGFDGYRTDRTMETTDREGRFRVVTIPGKSLLMVQVHGREKVDGEEMSPYQTARPDPDYKDLFKYEKDDDTWLFTSAGGLEFLSIENVVKVVDLKKDGGEIKIELPVERGKTARVLVQDADGKPLKGVVAAGLTAQWPVTFRLKATDRPVTVYALDPAHARRVVFLHREKKLGGTVLVRGDEKEPIVIKLAPLGSVTGRFLEGEGEPLVGAEITVNCPDRTASELYRHLGRTAPSVLTNKEGRFTLPGVVPGMRFYLQTRKGNSYFVGDPKIGLREVEPAQTLDLGDRKLKPQN